MTMVPRESIFQVLVLDFLLWVLDFLSYSVIFTGNFMPGVLASLIHSYNVMFGLVFFIFSLKKSVV